MTDESDLAATGVDPGGEIASDGGRPRASRPVRVPSRTALNYIVDAALAALFLTLVWLVAIDRFVFPAGQEAFRFRLWGSTIDDWRQYQFVALCGLSFVIVVHVTGSARSQTR